MASLAPLLKPVKVCKGEYLYLKGDSLDGIYFVKKGEAAYVEKRTHADLMFAYCHEGGYFGDVDFAASNQTSESKRLFSVKALTDMDLLLLEKSVLFNIDVEFKREVLHLFEHSHRQVIRLQRL